MDHFAGPRSTGTKLTAWASGGRQASASFALRVEDGGMEDLEARKVYRVLPDHEPAREGYVRVVDESGEDYIYPSDLFVPVTLPAAVVRRLRGPVRSRSGARAGRFGAPGKQIETRAPRQRSSTQGHSQEVTLRPSVSSKRGNRARRDPAVGVVVESSRCHGVTSVKTPGGSSEACTGIAQAVEAPRK